MLVFESLTFLDTKQICRRFIARILRFMSCLFLAILVSSPSTPSFWSHCLSCWEGPLVSQNHASGADWLSLCLVKLLAMYLTRKRTGNQEGCFHYKNKLSISSTYKSFAGIHESWTRLLQISFIEHVFQDALPIVLVGHSIGSHISLELFRRYQKKVIYCICLYPFLAADAASSKQATIRRIVMSPAQSTGLSSLGAVLGFLPACFSRFIARKILGNSCSPSTVEVLCTHVLKYHVIRNMLFMAKTEFEKLPEKPDFDFIGGNRSKLAFLFGSDDHWGPLRLYEEIYKKVPNATLAIEREGHTHAFSCTDAGSTWVARHVCGLIKNYLPNDVLLHN